MFLCTVSIGAPIRSDGKDMQQLMNESENLRQIDDEAGTLISDFAKRYDGERLWANRLWLAALSVPK